MTHFVGDIIDIFTCLFDDNFKSTCETTISQKNSKFLTNQNYTPCFSLLILPKNNYSYKSSTIIHNIPISLKEKIVEP